MIKKKFFLFMVIITTAIIVLFGQFYYSYVSDVVYKESTTHLTEIYSQVGHSLSNLLSENWRAMDMWIPYFKNADDENIKSFIENIRQTSAFTDFYFINKDSSYCTINGYMGSMDLGRNMKKLMEDGENIVTDTALIDRSELVVFAVPCPDGSYMNFSYSAIAISFNNDDIVSLLSAKTFDDRAMNYVIYSDGRVVVNNKGEHGDEIDNFWQMLVERSTTLSDDNLTEYRSDICYNGSGVNKLLIDGQMYYLAYESIGFKDWILIGIVPADVVNENMNKLQTVTMSASVSVVAVISLLSLLYLICKNYKSIRQKDTEIKYREELFSVLSNNVDDIFIMLDHNSFKVGYVSPNIEKILGISQSEAMKNVEIIEGAANNGEHKSVRKRFIALSENERTEWDSEYIHRKSGDLRWFHVTVLRSKIGGDDKYILVLSDRTKERMNHIALHNAVDEAKKANMAKSVFLSNMSHDIRTPLNSIINFASLALSESGNAELMSDYIGKIQVSGKQLLRLINNILDISVIESGRLSFNISDVDLSHVLCDIRTIISSHAGEKQQKLFIGMVNVEHETVCFDRNRLNQLLINLLSNAVKFTPEKGSVSLYITEEESEQVDTSIYEIRVADNGIGMSDEFKERIFDPFEREGVDRNIVGTGLGMPIAKSIVDTAGGSITLNTKQGHGSEFIVRLPLKISHNTARNINAEKLNALVIDADEAQRVNTFKALKRLGINAYSAADFSAESLSTEARKIHYDILVTDTQFVAEAANYLQKNKADNIAYIVTVKNSSEQVLSEYSEIICGMCEAPVLTYDMKRVLSQHFSGIFDDEASSKDEALTEEELLRGFKDKHILLAEDVLVNVQIVKVMLSKYKIKIDAAKDGKEALEMFRNNPDNYYNAILMDVQMPVMDGYESTRNIRMTGSAYAREVPIIAMTANAFDDDKIKAEASGMTDFLTKPVSADELIRALTQIIT